MRSTYIEIGREFILCRDDLDNGKSENIHWNVRWKYRHWTYTICSQIFPTRSSSFTNSPTKRQIWVDPHFKIIKTDEGYNHRTIEISKYVDRFYWRPLSSELGHADFSLSFKLYHLIEKNVMKRTICWIFWNKETFYRIRKIRICRWTRIDDICVYSKKSKKINN